MLSPDKEDEVKEGRAESQHKEIKKIESAKPFEIWELWTSYDVDEDGEEDDIVLTFHKESGTILSGIYNPLFIGFKPFVPLVFYPHEYSIDGEGVAEILESVQYELDSLHNQKLDRLTQINNPVVFVRSGSNLEDLEYLEPGKVYVVDDELEVGILYLVEFEYFLFFASNEFVEILFKTCDDCLVRIAHKPLSGLLLPDCQSLAVKSNIEFVTGVSPFQCKRR